MVVRHIKTLGAALLQLCEKVPVPVEEGCVVDEGHSSRARVVEELSGSAEVRAIGLAVAAALAPVNLAQEVGQTERPVVVELRGGVVVVDPRRPGLAG